MKRKLFSILALLLMALTAQATDYPTGLTDGQVLHVGDTFTPETTYHLPNWSINSNIAPVKLVRFNVTQGVMPFEEAKLEEAADGQYYGFMDNDGDIRTYWDEYDNVLAGLGEYAFEATENSDGLIVTKSGANVSFAVHEAAASSATAVEVAWTAASKTGTFKMPGGNVELEPEYYPQAAFAMSTDATPVALAPKASTSARANTDDPLVEGGTVAGIVDDEALLEEGQGTLLYHFSATQLDAAALEALTATDWTDKVPTADGLAEGTAYVYYYIKGADDLPGITPGAKFTFSDSDIQELAVTLLPEPTYNVDFAEGTNPEAPAEPIWTATPNTGLKKGQTVTVTYTGTKKVLGVKAEKKSAAPAKPLANATAEDLGKIAGADGNIYDTKAAAEAANTTAVAMIAYVGSASDCTHGLAIALADESGTKTWSEAGAACSGKTAVTGGTWRLPSIKDWQYMFIGCGASGSYSDSPSTMSYSELATKLTTANGTALQTVSYWSSTESSPGEDAWSLYFGGSSASFFSGDYEGDAHPIRACLVF